MTSFADPESVEGGGNGDEQEDEDAGDESEGDESEGDESEGDEQEGDEEEDSEDEPDEDERDEQEDEDSGDEDERDEEEDSEEGDEDAGDDEEGSPRALRIHSGYQGLPQRHEVVPRRRPGLRRDPGPQPRSGAERVRSRLAAQQPVDQSSGERVSRADRVHDVHHDPGALVVRS